MHAHVHSHWRDQYPQKEQEVPILEAKGPSVAHSVGFFAPVLQTLSPL